MVQVVETTIAIAVVAELSVGETVAVPGMIQKMYYRNYNIETVCAHNFKHCDFVQLHGFLGRTPEASKVCCTAGALSTLSVVVFVPRGCGFERSSFRFRNAS